MNRFILILFALSSTYLFAASNDEFKSLYKCFDIHLVKIEIERDRVRWPGNSFTNVCSIGLTIDSTTPTYFYYSRGWRSPELCNQFVKDWSDLKKKNKEVCIAARLDPIEKKEDMGKEFFQRSAPYEVIKSGNWCHSYFDGYCD